MKIHAASAPVSHVPCPEQCLNTSQDNKLVKAVVLLLMLGVVCRGQDSPVKRDEINFFRCCCGGFHFTCMYECACLLSWCSRQCCCDRQPVNASYKKSRSMPCLQLPWVHTKTRMCCPIRLKLTAYHVNCSSSGSRRKMPVRQSYAV